MEVTHKKESVLKDLVLSLDSASDTYEILWGKFPSDLCNWLWRLQMKVPRDSSWKINCKWTHKDLVALHRLDTELTRVVDFWVETTLDGYIVEFATE